MFPSLANFHITSFQSTKHQKLYKGSRHVSCKNLDGLSLDDEMGMPLVSVSPRTKARNGLFSVATSPFPVAAVPASLPDFSPTYRSLFPLLPRSIPLFLVLAFPPVPVSSTFPCLFPAHASCHCLLPLTCHIPGPVPISASLFCGE